MDIHSNNRINERVEYVQLDFIGSTIDYCPRDIGSCCGYCKVPFSFLSKNEFRVFRYYIKYNMTLGEICGFFIGATPSITIYKNGKTLIPFDSNRTYLLLLQHTTRLRLARVWCISFSS